MPRKRSAAEAMEDFEEGSVPPSEEEENLEESGEQERSSRERSARETIEEVDDAGGSMDDNGEENKEMEDVREEEKEANEEPDDSDAGQEARSLFKQINLEGRSGVAGLIKSVYCENFMNHRKLRIDFNRNVTFINGQNGSGKSAILAAIQVCLGANAKSTHRARNLKELVRKEAAGRNPNTSAKVRVTILNEGPDGYKPDLYGDEITVERSISLRSGGQNGYKLLSAELKEVSTEKKELYAMLDHLNIQIDNPVAVLSQEDAKTFLNGKASDKYDFFMRATELERIDRKYAETKETCTRLKSKQDALISSLEKQAAIADELKKKYDMHTSVQKLERKLIESHVNYAWAYYGERNDDFERAREHQQRIQEKVDAKQLELTQAEEEASGANDVDEEKRIREEMEELRQEAESQSELKVELEQELKRVNVPYKTKERELKTLKKESDRAKQELSRARRRLQETRQEILEKAGSAETEEARRTARLNEAEQELAKAKEESNGLKQAQATANRDYEELGPEVEQARSNTATKSSHNNAVKHKIEELKSSSTANSLAVFGQKCARLHQLVEDAKNTRRFQGQVYGPIGAYIKVAPGKEQYAKLAEKALGGNNLDRFIVTNDHDRKVFQALRDQAKCQGKECGLYQVSVHPRFQVPAPPSDAVETVASTLLISNDVVFNCLVDNARIDQRALAPSKEVSERHLLKSENGRYSIKGNINEVYFLPSGDKWTVQNGSMSIASNESGLRGQRIGVDRSEAIAEAERELAQLNSEVQELRATETDLIRRQKELQRRWNQHKRAYKENLDRIDKLSSEIEDIRTEMETTANITIDTTDLEEDIAQTEELVTNLDEQLAERQKDLEDLEPEIDDVRRRLEEVATRNEKVILDMQEAETKLEACLSRQTQSDAFVQKRKQKLDQYKEVLEKHQSKVDETDQQKKEALLKARTLTLKQKFQQEQEADNGSQVKFEFDEEDLEQVEIQKMPKTSEFYATKIHRQREKIEIEKEKKALSNEDPAAALQKWQNALQKLEGSQKVVKDTQVLLQTLEADLTDRKRRWRKLQKHLSSMTDHRFDEILQLNKQSGQLEFDHEGHELNLVVQKNINDTSSQTKDVKALSGGERSYTTMSLLLALGESLETPFRLLDEFDVFMDPQARKLTIQTLIHVATTKLMHRQFIFITPQDLSSIKAHEMVKIVKLKPPERNLVAGGPVQQTIDFSQAA